MSIPDDELQQGTTLRDGDVVIEVVGQGCRRHPIRFSIWAIIATVGHFRGLRLGGLGLPCSLHYALPCHAGPQDAPSPDSSEARTIRSRIGRGRRSRSRSPGGSQPSFRFFPPDAQRAVAPPLPPFMCGTRVLPRRVAASIRFLVLRVS